MRRRVQLITLDCALVVAEEGSFLGASRRMGIHHSALSRRIRDLEHSLGTVLFERHAGGVRPTLAAAGFLQNLRRIMTELDGTLAMFTTVRGSQAGNIVTGLNVPLQLTEVLDALADFLRSRPDVDLRLVEARRNAARLP